MRRAILLLALASCGRAEEAIPESAARVSLPDPSTVGSIAGRILVKGEVPPPARLPISASPECSAMHDGPATDTALLVKDGRVRNAVVLVAGSFEPFAFGVPAGDVVVDNRRCLFEPRVAVARTWQRVVFRNSDATAHNVRGDGFNVMLPVPGAQHARRFGEAGRRPVKCDLHPWMLGWVVVTATPFAAVTGEDGSFRIDGVPEGEREVEVWHERLGARKASVRVERGTVATLEVELNP